MSIREEGKKPRRAAWVQWFCWVWKVGGSLSSWIKEGGGKQAAMSKCLGIYPVILVSLKAANPLGCMD